MRVVSVRAASVVLVVAAGCSSSSRVVVQTSTPRTPTTTATTAGGKTVTASAVKPCTATDLQLSAQWVHAHVAVTRSQVPPGQVPQPTAIMDGTLSITNVSTTTCSAPTNVSVAIVGPTGRLNVASQDRAIPTAGYMDQRPLVRGAMAIASLVWQPSWCGPDPGPSPTLLVTFPPDPPLKIQVLDQQPATGHVPSCTPGQPASVIVVGSFTVVSTSLVPPATPSQSSSLTGQYGSGQTVTLSPSTGLHDGDVIHVAGTAYKPNETLVVTECVDVGPQTGVTDCNLPTDKPTSSDANGSVSMDFAVIIGPIGSVKATCGQPNPCLVAVTTVSYTPTDAAHADIGFAP